MNSVCRIRPLRPDEAQQALDLILQGMEEAHLPLTIYLSHGYAAYLKSLLTLPQPLRETWYFGAEQGGRLVGMSEWRVLPDCVFLNNIYIDQEKRGGGIGKKLFAMGIELARRYGLTILALDVFDAKKEARRWYEDLGFVAIQDSIWLTGDNLAQPTDSGCAVLNYPQAQALQEVYGFSMLDVRTAQGLYHVGRIGDRLYRINSAAYRDQALLAGLKQLDPKRRLLVISSEADAATTPELRIACRITRMKLDDPEAKAWNATLSF
jgi:GNAT superfamily N-acetyltransferase